MRVETNMGLQVSGKAAASCADLQISYVSDPWINPKPVNTHCIHIKYRTLWTCNLLVPILGVIKAQLTKSGQSLPRNTGYTHTCKENRDIWQTSTQMPMRQCNMNRLQRQTHTARTHTPATSLGTQVAPNVWEKQEGDI